MQGYSITKVNFFPGQDSVVISDIARNSSFTRSLKNRDCILKKSVCNAESLSSNYQISSHDSGDSETDIHVQLSQIPCNVHKIRIQILCYFFAKKVHHFNLFLCSCSLQNRSCFLFTFFRRAKASAKQA